MRAGRMILALTTLLAAALLTPILAQPETAAGANRYIVVFQKATPAAERFEIVRSAGAQILKPLALVDGVVVHLPDQASDKARQAILAHAPVVRIDQDIQVFAIGKPSKPPKKPKDEPQPEETLPWGVDRIDAELIWDLSLGASAKVAVLDSGISTQHPDLQPNLAGGINTINPRKSYNDDNGHGSFVAGIIAAADNEIGVIGVANGASLYAVKVLNRQGWGWLSDIIEGLDWCIQNDIHVANMSFGSASGNDSYHEAIAAVHAAGITMVAATGNEGADVCFPAAYPETIAVTATDSSDDIPSWNNTGPQVTVAAPGVDVHSTYKGEGYAIGSGTSAAAPHVAGVVALILENIPLLTPDDVRDILEVTADDLGYGAALQGSGLVDAEEAVLLTE